MLELRDNVRAMHPQTRDNWALTYETRNSISETRDMMAREDATLNSASSGLPYMRRMLKDIHYETANTMLPRFDDVDCKMKENHATAQAEVVYVRSLVGEVAGNVEEVMEKVNGIDERLVRVSWRVQQSSQNQESLITAVDRLSNDIERAETKRQAEHKIVVDRLDKLLKAMEERSLLP